MLYYYLCMMLVNIVGIPTLNEFIRMSQLGEPFFKPNINLIPFSDGLSFSFVANIFLFIPFGFLCPLISSAYLRVKNVFFIGLGLSLFIEIVQLFTLYRATDINDLLTNVIGTLIGYCCFRFVQKIRGQEATFPQPVSEERPYGISAGYYYDNRIRGGVFQLRVKSGFVE